MSFVCKPGESLFLRKINSPIEHLWIILTDPQGNPQKSVIVNVTSKRPESETTVVLKKGDHPFITHDSVINFKDATLALSDKLEEAVNAGHFCDGGSFDQALLKTIQEGLQKSKQTPKDIKSHCNAVWNPSPTSSTVPINNTP
jgi:hypothetical protein